jgi:hypothetical protein
LAAIVLSVFVLADSLRPARRASAAARLREPWWIYPVIAADYLILLLVVQIIPGLQFAAAIAALASPVALALGVPYLLRVVFPRATTLATTATTPDSDPGDAQ